MDSHPPHIRCNFLVGSFLLALCFVLLAPLGANAQGVRALGMGGVSVPASGGLGNPAFAALPQQDNYFSLPLPLGVANFLLRPDLDPGSEEFDLLAAFDQAAHLGSFLLNPAQSPDEIVISIENVGGTPSVAIELIGGSPLLITEGDPVAFGQAFELPIGFGVGSVGLGLRPYLDIEGTITPREGFSELFEQGASSGRLAGELSGEAGVGLSISFATPLPVPGPAVYLGVRAEPFLGLARVDATGDFTVTTTENASGETEYVYLYEADTFYSLISEGGMGYGAYADIGAAVSSDLPGGRFTAGVAVHDLGVGIWQGLETTVQGDSTGNSSQSTPTPATRTYLFDDYSISANGAMLFDSSAVGSAGLSSLLVAVDGSYGDGAVATHAGAEGSFGRGAASLLLRTGVGYENGLVAGFGIGTRLVGFGVDAALHTYRSPLTTHQAVGVSLGLGFGF